MSENPTPGEIDQFREELGKAGIGCSHATANRAMHIVGIIVPAWRSAEFVAEVINWTGVGHTADSILGASRAVRRFVVQGAR